MLNVKVYDTSTFFNPYLGHGSSGYLGVSANRIKKLNDVIGGSVVPECNFVRPQ